MKPVYQFTWLFSTLILLCVTSSCAVNGIGYGFTVATSSSQMGTIEHVNGYGILFDTRSPTRSVSIGEIDRFLLCPSAQQNSGSNVPLALFSDINTVQVDEISFDSKLCQYGSVVMRERTGLSIDFSVSHLRLMIGHQRHTIMRIKQDVSSVFHVQFNSGEIANGKAIVLIPKELNE